jgi:hypothetical protein
MDDLPLELLLAGGAAMLLAVIAWLADHRRMRRSNPDAVGFMPWTTLFLWGVFVGVLLLAAGGQLWFAG